MVQPQHIYELPTQSGLDQLIKELQRQGYQVIAPVIRDGAVVPSEIQTLADLPIGYRDEQEKGHYRLKRAPGDLSFFGYNLGPGSWKSFLFPERRKLWRLTPDGEPESALSDPRPMAFLGVRSCELAAIKIQDRVFIRSGGDDEYRRRREKSLIIGIHCRTAAATCFCASMGTGPEFPEGWDLLLTELEDRLLIQAGTERGRAILTDLGPTSAGSDAETLIAGQLERTASLITRKMDQRDIKETIYNAVINHDWDDVGSRCLSCANCTLVCPTCFCSTVEDVSDVTGEHAERWQKWDSCFHVDFSYTHGGPRRETTASRYRQWFTHKLASWHDQFDTSGCVGCGRCIAWCPVGIDLTEEMSSIRQKAELRDKGDSK